MDPFIIIIIVFLVAILGIAVWAGAAPCTVCKKDEVDGTKPWYSFLCFEGDEFDAGEAECDWAPAVSNDTGGGADPGGGTTTGGGADPGGGTTPGGDGKKIGCMNVSKFNYDPDAKVAGPCEDVVEGCIDDTKLGYNSSANTAADPDVCGATIVTGCTDPGRAEYNSAANKDDGSCANFAGGTVDIKLLNTEDPLVCPYAGEAFVCADLVACKETLLEEGQEVSYLDMRENICNPADAAKRKTAAELAEVFGVGAASCTDMACVEEDGSCPGDTMKMPCNSPSSCTVEEGYGCVDRTKINVARRIVYNLKGLTLDNYCTDNPDAYLCSQGDNIKWVYNDYKDRLYNFLNPIVTEYNNPDSSYAADYEVYFSEIVPGDYVRGRDPEDPGKTTPIPWLKKPGASVWPLQMCGPNYSNDCTIQPPD